MKQLRIAGLGFIAGLALLGAGFLASSQVAAQDEAISVGSGTVAIGAEGSVPLDALDMPEPGLAAWSIDITYDPAVVTVLDCVEEAGAAFCNESYDDPDTEENEASYTIRLAGASGQGLVGDTTLATLTFRCDAEGTSALSLITVDVHDGTQGDPQRIEAAALDGEISCVTQVAGEGAAIKIGSGTAAVGGRAAVELEALDVPEPGLGAWTIDAAYDTGIVSAVSCTPGSDGLSVCNPEFADDTVRVTGANIDGLPGDSTLASITFECEAEGSSDLTLTVQVLADATIGNPQTIEAFTIDGEITCTPSAPAPTPTPTPPPVLPKAGSGGGFGWDSGSPLSWLIAGLAGAGIAWLLSGVASAGFSAVTSSGEASSGPEAVSRQIEERLSSLRAPTRTMPTARRKLNDLPAPPLVEPDWFRRPKRS